ncbi:NADH-quinone oxidoreductase subunit B [Panacibacter ginsenosidivorans]|uniref:NADH-quinone oxidoreductase subunit B n=1 Tax=Panacibacter ginsenosidivorans TaxID=1813871 RepID=UPI004041FF15
MDVKDNIQNKADFPGQVHQTPGGGVLISKLDEVINWARANSLWPLVFGTSCCAIEMMSTASAKYDWSRFGFEVARATPRQADVIIIAGTIVNKMAPVLKRLYDQMPDPKYVIAMGACATSGGPFFYNTYSVVKGADHVIPVDVYIAGCPPRPEALIHALIALQNKIKAGGNIDKIHIEKQ